MKNKVIVLSIVVMVLVAMLIWMVWENSALELNTIPVRSASLPESFAGYKIAQVSDLHNTQIGKDNETLLAMLKEAAPDMIAITGDMIDSGNTMWKLLCNLQRKRQKLPLVIM